MKKFNILGTDDSVNTCDCCGKTDLKATWAVEIIETGEILHYGSVCVTRNTGIKHPESSAKAHEREQMALAAAELRQTPEYRAERAKFELRNSLPRMELMSAIAFVKGECDALEAKKRELMAKYRITYLFA